jgi:hypothetical protein
MKLNHTDKSARKPACGYSATYNFPTVLKAELIATIGKQSVVAARATAEAVV